MFQFVGHFVLGGTPKEELTHSATYPPILPPCPALTDSFARSSAVQLHSGIYSITERVLHWRGKKGTGGNRSSSRRRSRRRRRRRTRTRGTRIRTPTPPLLLGMLLRLTTKHQKTLLRNGTIRSSSVPHVLQFVAMQC